MSYVRRNTKRGLAVAAVVALIILLVGSCGAAYFSSTSNVTFTVKRLVDQSRKDGHRYMVFTDRGVYENKDNIFFLKTNSSDLFNELQEGHRYTCKIVGFRISLTSSYKNLISCNEEGN